MMDSNYSLADIAAATGGNRSNDGWGGGEGGAWWLIVLFIFAFCGWGGGFGNGFNGGANGAATQGALTRGDLCMDMNFQEVKREVQNANDAVNLGFANLNSTICNQQYDTARMIDNLGSTIRGGFNTTNVAMLQGQNAIQSQLAQCCCDLREQISGVNYNMAQNTCALTNQLNNNTRDIIQSQEAGTRAILDYLCQDKISALQSENQALKLAASQANQNVALGAMMDANTAEILRRTAPTPVPAYSVPAPYPYGYVGYNGNCGCGCGCGNNAF